MFGIDITILAFIGLATLAAGAIAYVFMYDQVSNEQTQAKRIASIKDREDSKRNSAKARVNDVAKRRQSVQDSLKELDEKQKKENKKNVSLKAQLRQAGMNITVKQFAVISVLAGCAAAIVSMLSGLPPYAAPAAGIVVGLGLPRMYVARRRKKRMNQFLAEFPNSVDVIVRGIKAGLPLNDCLGIIARESREPVASEFKKILDTQAMGIPMPQAILKLYDNMPLTEANFFGIVISIQQSAGGNLSESLGNLSGVLRDRKKMKAKIQAMSAEAKASGMIIGALPFVVAILVYLTSPDYIMLLFTDPTGNMVLLCAGVWMSMGVFVMKKMINFDF